MLKRKIEWEPCVFLESKGRCISEGYHILLEAHTLIYIHEEDLYIEEIAGLSHNTGPTYREWVENDIQTRIEGFSKIIDRNKRIYRNQTYYKTYDFFNFYKLLIDSI